MSDILLLVPPEADNQRLVHAFEEAGLSTKVMLNPEGLVFSLSHRAPRALVLDARFMAHSSVQLLETLRDSAGDVPVVLMVDAGDKKLRLKSLLLGVEDCVVRPCTDEEVVLRVCRLLDNYSGFMMLNEELKTRRDQTHEIRGELAGLRQELGRHLSFLKAGVEFHRHLDPAVGRTELLSRFLEQLSAQTGLSRLAYLGRTHADSSWYRTLATWGVPESLCSRLRVPAEGKLARTLRGQPGTVLTGDLSGANTERGLLEATGFTAVIPQMSASELMGLILIGDPLEAQERELAEFLVSSFTPLLVMHSRQAQGICPQASVVGSLVGQLESRDPYLQGHSSRVARFCEELGIKAGLSREDLSWLVIAGTIHDVGRFESDAKLWTKTGPLTAADWDVVKAHPLESARLAAAAGWPEAVLDAVRHHHERWDGTGYPFGLEGNNIPLFARIIAIVDAYDALVSPRSWRPPLSPASALEELEHGAGTRYDPELLRLFLESHRAQCA